MQAVLVHISNKTKLNLDNNLYIIMYTLPINLLSLEGKYEVRKDKWFAYSHILSKGRDRFQIQVWNSKQTYV